MVPFILLAILIVLGPQMASAQTISIVNREKGLPPLTEPEREAIIRYLGHHAKS